MCRVFGGKIGDDYAWELDLFYKYRDFSDGIDFFEFKMGLDKYPCDHNPKYEFCLRILNVTMFEFSVYNLWHMDHECSPYYNTSHQEWDHCRREYDDGPDYEKDNHD